MKSESPTLESRLRAKGWKGVRSPRVDEPEPCLLRLSGLAEAPASLKARERALREHAAKVERLRQRLRSVSGKLRERAAASAHRQLRAVARALRAESPERGSSRLALIIIGERIAFRACLSVLALRDLREGLRDYARERREVREEALAFNRKLAAAQAKGQRMLDLPVGVPAPFPSFAVLQKPLKGFQGYAAPEHRPDVAESDLSTSEALQSIGGAFEALAFRESEGAVSFALKRAEELREERERMLSRPVSTFDAACQRDARCKLLSEAADALRAFGLDGTLPHHRSRAYAALRSVLFGGDSRREDGARVTRSA